MNIKHFVLLLTAVVSMGLAGSAFAQLTPSTNDQNRTNGWAHVNQISVGVGTTDLEFVNPRVFASCFEYRTDGDLSQSTGDNFNPGILDGLYPFICENDSSTTLTIAAEEYVEVRMVFGAESDERFDWTRFDVEPAPALPVPVDSPWALLALIASLLAVSGLYLSRRAS